MLRERFFGQKWSDENVDHWSDESIHHVTAAIKADDVRKAKSIFRDIIENELGYSLSPSERIYAEDDGFHFQCSVVLRKTERYP